MKSTDALLLERSGLDEFTLHRLRAAFRRSLKARNKELREANKGSVTSRFSWLVGIMRDVFTPAQQTAWLAYLEHSSHDIEDMCSGVYPISPYLTRIYSALFGVGVEWLLFGKGPYKGSVDIDMFSGAR